MIDDSVSVAEKVFLQLADMASTQPCESAVFHGFSRALLLDRAHVERARSAVPDEWTRKVQHNQALHHLKRATVLMNEMTEHGICNVYDDEESWNEMHALLGRVPSHYLHTFCVCLLDKFMDSWTDTASSRGFVYHVVHRCVKANCLDADLMSSLLFIGGERLMIYALEACPSASTLEALASHPMLEIEEHRVVFDRMMAARGLSIRAQAVESPRTGSLVSLPW